MRSSYAIELGRRLRAARMARHWTLKEASASIGGRFSTAVISSYERGDRAVNADGLAVLAAAYHTTSTALLPDHGAAAGPQLAAEPRPVSDAPLRLTVTRLQQLPPHLSAPMLRYATALLAARGTPSARQITVRDGDIIVLVALLQTSPARLIAQLRRVGAIT